MLAKIKLLSLFVLFIYLIKIKTIPNVQEYQCFTVVPGKIDKTEIEIN
jgi:hypothetical protein